MKYFPTSQAVREVYGEDKISEAQLNEFWKDADEASGQMPGYWLPDDIAPAEELKVPEHFQEDMSVEDHAKKHGPDYLTLVKLIREHDAKAAAAMMIGQPNIILSYVEQFIPMQDVACVAQSRAYAQVLAFAKANDGGLSGQDVMDLVAGAFMDGFLTASQFKKSSKTYDAPGQYL